MLKTPEEFIGHPVGADYQLADWTRIHGYFLHVARESDRVHTRRLTTTTQGRPYIAAEISGAAAIREREKHLADRRKVADPRLIADPEEFEREILAALASSPRALTASEIAKALGLKNANPDVLTALRWLVRKGLVQCVRDDIGYKRYRVRGDQVVVPGLGRLQKRILALLAREGGLVQDDPRDAVDAQQVHHAVHHGNVACSHHV